MAQASGVLPRLAGALPGSSSSAHTQAGTRLGLGRRADRDIATACRVLGASFAGFFDGIVIHQLLQWHHMLCPNDECMPHSLAVMEAMEIPDGLFHAACFLANLLGLWLLLLAVKQRVRGSVPPDTRTSPGGSTGTGTRASSSVNARHFGSRNNDDLATSFASWTWARCAGWMLQGGGAFQIVEGTVDHLILRIHRVRPRSTMPLAWDLGFLAAGAAILVLGAWMASDISARISPGGYSRVEECDSESGGSHEAEQSAEYGCRQSTTVQAAWECPDEAGLQMGGAVGDLPVLAMDARPATPAAAQLRRRSQDLQ